jgi:hypothetical protein
MKIGGVALSWIKELILIEKPKRPDTLQRNMAALAITAVMVLKFFFSGRGASDGLLIVVAVWFLLIFQPNLWATVMQFVLWTVLTVLHWFSLLALTVVFYLAFWPIGFWKRKKGWDPMRWKRDPGATSYREPPEELRENHFLKPF